MSDYILHHFLQVATDFEPETFGRLTTIGPRFKLRYKSGNRRCHQVCLCECGNCVVVQTTNLRNGNTKTCGCSRNENIKKAVDATRTHGKSTTIEYIRWQQMKSRCLNPSNKRFSHYGGRGINVCDSWLEPDGRGFTNFLEDMGRRPSTKHSIDRIDVNGDYCKENCRWATVKEQNTNKVNNIRITAFGRTMCLSEWSESSGIPAGTIQYRIQNDWEVEIALTKKPNSR